MPASDSETVPRVESESQLTKGERTRERILDLAQDSIVAKGFHATSIDELVDAAGIVDHRAHGRVVAEHAVGDA